MPEAVSSPPSATDRWKAWDSFVEATPETGFMQSSWWADFRTTVGYGHFGAILKDKNGIVGGAVVQRFPYAPQRCFYYIQDDPVRPRDEFVPGEVFRASLENIEARRKAENETVSHLRSEPRWERLPSFVSGFRAIPPLADPYLQARDTPCINLRPSQ